MVIRCPHCHRTIGGRNTEDTGFRLRLSITLVGDNGDVHGPCPHCKQTLIVAKSTGLVKALQVDDGPTLVLRVRRRG